MQKQNSLWQELIFILIGGVGVAVADKKGEFMINNGELLHNIDTLCFSFVGYRTRKFAVASLLQKKNVILLQEEPFILGEVSVYGIKKNLLTFAIYTNIINACPTIFVCNDFIRKETVYYRWR